MPAVSAENDVWAFATACPNEVRLWKPPEGLSGPLAAPGGRQPGDIVLSGCGTQRNSVQPSRRDPKLDPSWPQVGPKLAQAGPKLAQVGSS